MKKIKEICMAIALIAAFAAPSLAATPRLTTYTPSEDVLELVESMGVWAEIYPVKAKDAAKALERALASAEPPAPHVVGLITAARIFITLDSKPQMLEEQVSALTRKGVLVEPGSAEDELKEGDHFRVVYEDKTLGVSAVLDTVVQKYIPDGDASVSLLKGTLELRTATKSAEKHEVLVQAIVNP